MKIQYNLKPMHKRRFDSVNLTKTLGFGKLRTDHIFLMDYVNGHWSNSRIVPYQSLELAPGAMALHYGQSVFEGAKAFLHYDGEIYTFRIDKNCERLNQSAKILSMPQVPIEMQQAGINALLDVERNWMPKQENASMYIRPFMFATDDDLSVRASDSYTYAVMLSPSGSYYPNGMNKSIKLLISKTYHRAVTGGTGAAKAAGNYAASLRAQKQAIEYGADQVLYLDANNQYIEEVGAMNHFHITHCGKLVIPEFTDTILQSITSQSILALSPQLESLFGITAVQEKIPCEQFIADIRVGKIVEAGGFGTAALATSVGSYVLESKHTVQVADGNIGPLTAKLYDFYTAMQNGKIAAPDNWFVKVERNS